MANDKGVYILVSPSKEDSTRAEYRVTYLENGNGILEEIEAAGSTDAVNPSAVKSHFTKVPVFTDSFDADEEAFRLADNQYLTHPSVYHLYITTPFAHWGPTTYAKKNNN